MIDRVFVRTLLAAAAATILIVIGRLKPGGALEQARADMNTITRRLAQQCPETNKGWLAGGKMVYD